MTLISCKSWPCHGNEENGVAPSSRLFMTQSFLYLQVMMTCMKAPRSSKFGHIVPPTAELGTLERLKKNSHRSIMGKQCFHFF